MQSRPISTVQAALFFILVASLSVTAPAQGMGAQVRPLPFRVSDAEFSTSLGLIVAVSTQPTTSLWVHDPDAGSSQSLPLPIAGVAVSVAPDGNTAVVGHASAISHVDLRTLTIIRTLPVSTVLGDVVLGGNGWAYVFPNSGQWIPISSVELSTGREVIGPGTIREGTKARLHPSGRFIYGANNGLSPSDIEKYDITTGGARYLYDSPYHGEYSMAGNLWFTEDGFRIIVRGANTFRSSELRAEDMLFSGRLAQAQLLNWATHSTESRLILVIPAPQFGGMGPEDTVLQVYGDQLLDHRGTYPFPRFPAGSTSFASHGRFVFHDGPGMRAWSVVRADASSGLLFDDGVVGFTIETATRALSADVETVSISLRGAQRLTLDAGTSHAGSHYWLLGSTNGTQPGIPFDRVRLPLNFEFFYFLHTATRPNQWPLVNGVGTLDGAGRADARFDLAPVALSPELIGMPLHHAYLVFDANYAAVFASNAERVLLVR